MPVASATGSTSPLFRLTRDYSAGGARLVLGAEPRQSAFLSPSVCGLTDEPVDGLSSQVPWMRHPNSRRWLWRRPSPAEWAQESLSGLSPSRRQGLPRHHPQAATASRSRGRTSGRAEGPRAGAQGETQGREESGRGRCKATARVPCLNRGGRRERGGAFSARQGGRRALRPLSGSGRAPTGSRAQEGRPLAYREEAG
jgi:hypothetical protein